jgi:Icc-related predicted phosphoesterase
MATNVKILLMHYSPTYKTLEGENPRFFSTLGSQVYENILLNRKPDLVLHGHNYRGTKQAWIETVPVFNVSLPLNKEIVIIDTEKLKPGLAKFVKEI